MKNPSRYITTIIIIAAAAGIAWWSSRSEAGVINHIQHEVEKLVPRFHRDPDTIRPLVVDPVIESTLAALLQFIYVESVDKHQEIIVVVKSGDDEFYGDGTATHVATIRLNQKSVAGLRIICSSKTGPLRIAGAWTP